MSIISGGGIPCSLEIRNKKIAYSKLLGLSTEDSDFALLVTKIMQVNYQ